MLKVWKTGVVACVVASLCLAIGCSGGTGEAGSVDSADSSSATEKSRQTNEGTLDSFIEVFNGVSPLGFRETERFLPHDEYVNRGPHFRVEYRLGPFSDSVAASGAIGEGTTADIVSYGYGLHHIRVYAVPGSSEERDQLVRDLVTVFNTGATEEEIGSVIARAADGGMVHLTDIGLNGYVNGVGGELMAELIGSTRGREPLYKT